MEESERFTEAELVGLEAIGIGLRSFRILRCGTTDDWWCPKCEDWNPPDCGVCILCGFDPTSGSGRAR
jgi:hypothetical protein